MSLGSSIFLFIVFLIYVPHSNADGLSNSTIAPCFKEFEAAFSVCAQKDSSSAYIDAYSKVGIQKALRDNMQAAMKLSVNMAMHGKLGDQFTLLKASMKATADFKKKYGNACQQEAHQCVLACQGRAFLEQNNKTPAQVDQKMIRKIKIHWGTCSRMENHAWGVIRSAKNDEIYIKKMDRSKKTVFRMPKSAVYQPGVFDSKQNGDTFVPDGVLENLDKPETPPVNLKTTMNSLNYKATKYSDPANEQAVVESINKAIQADPAIAEEYSEVLNSIHGFRSSGVLSSQEITSAYQMGQISEQEYKDNQESIQFIFQEVKIRFNQ